MSNYQYILEYIPKRYSATKEQVDARNKVYSFKNGSCSKDLFDEICTVIKKTVGTNKFQWVLCFIPASTHQKTSQRYVDFARTLNKETGVTVEINAISVISDTESGHINGKSNNPVENFKFNKSSFMGKKVILIDDVITRGRTFNQTASKLLDLGASLVEGLFVAKTINPDWKAGAHLYYEEDFDPEEIYLDYMTTYNPEDEIDPEDAYLDYMTTYNPEDDINPEDY